MRPLLLILLLGAASVRAEAPEWLEIKVFQPHDAAVAEVFAGADTTWSETWTPTDAERAALETRLDEPVPEAGFTFHRGRLGTRELGWAVVLDEIGLHEPITHLVRIDAGGRVEEIRVLVFRETRGDEIRRPRFLKQFRGMDSGDRLRVGRDVDAVTGATYSSRAITRGVRKALALVEARYGGSAPSR